MPGENLVSFISFIVTIKPSAKNKLNKLLHRFEVLILYPWYNIYV